MKNTYRSHVSVRVKTAFVYSMYVVVGLMAFALANAFVAYYVPLDEYHYEGDNYDGK